MAGQSKIEWTEATWNPVTGCTKISPGCRFCYAERMAKRLQAMGNANYVNGFDVTLHPRMLDVPLTWKKPSMIFVNSMSDLFHENVPDEFIRAVFLVMTTARRHVFQVLTKRADRLLALSEKLPWPANVWAGVTVENADYVDRVHCLSHVPAAVRFLSLEPLLSSIPRLPLDGIGWVIVGGESGPGARPMDKKWVVEIKQQCEASDTPFFFKQWGGWNKKKTGRLLDGHTYDAMPPAWAGRRAAF